MKTILFFHGFNSSNTTNKFKVIDSEHKVSWSVNYSSLTHKEVALLYNKFIQQVQPDILVGHSLGGYWALLKSIEHKIPCVAINPTLHPHKTFDDYVDLKTLDFNDGVHRAYHLELQDEIIDQRAIQEWVENETSNYKIFSYTDGHHRCQYLDEINWAINDLTKRIG